MSKRKKENWMKLSTAEINDLEQEVFNNYKKGACLCHAFCWCECCCGAWDIEEIKP